MICGIVTGQVASTPSDANWASVTSLLHFNGINGSTTFTDQIGSAWSVVSSAQIDTSESKFGGASGSFPSGFGGYILKAANTAQDDFGTDDFTIEFFMLPSSLTANSCMVSRQDDAPSIGTAIQLRLSAAGDKAEAVLRNTAGGVTTITGTTTITMSAWVHYAITRESGTVRLFLDGNLEASGSQAGSLTDAAAPRFAIGARYNDDVAESYFNGNIDEFRITKGVARYTASFIPPTSQFADA